ncbi:MAG TPA: DNA replication/repair protein RecF [Actinomycetota bacterium]
MQLRSLRLTDFRNYADAAVEFRPGLNLVVGRNGQGKTNLLEAINVLSGLGSHRGAAGEAMVRQGAERAVLSGTGSAGGRDVRVDAEVKRTGGTRLLVNRVAVERMSASSSAGMLVAVAFSPDDLVIIKGGPEERRRLLDQGSARVRPLGATERQEFERVLRQRTGLLKAAPNSQRALATLDVWDESFARAGAVVVRNRMAVLDRLRPEVLRRYRSVSGQAGEVSVEYKASWLEPGTASTASEEGLRAALFDALAKARSRDLERGVSTVGPQRDDVEVLLEGADARLFASQGEQRTLALSLRMAERDLVAANRGEDPILLLDDIFSELDEVRRGHLVEMVAASGQTIATATSGAGWPMAVSQTLTVEAGRVLARE